MLPKVPAACADLDLAEVSRVLAKHYGDIPASARELKVSEPDLRHLTWARPKVLEEARDRCEEVVARAWGQLIEAIYSDDPRRQMWAADKILSSWVARDHPLAPARRRSAGTDVSVQNNKTVNYTFRWRTSEDDERDAEPAERERLRDGWKHVVSIGWGDDGKTIEHPACPEPSNKD
jgi:hypothetical protein